MEIDRELMHTVNQVLKGEEEGFQLFYKRTYPCVYFRAKQLLNNEEDIQDLIQDVYIEAYRSINNLKNINSLYPWLKQITFNMATKVYRKKKDILLNEEDQDVFNEIETEDVSNIPELSSDRQATSQIVAELISELPELQRIAVIAYYFDEFGISSIAQMMQCSEGTIKSRLNYARQFLKTRILEREKKEGFALHSIDFGLIYWAVKILENNTVVSDVTAQNIYSNICTSIGLHAAIVESSQTLGTAIAQGSVSAGNATAISTGVKGGTILAKWVAMGTGTKIAVSVGTVFLTVTVAVGGGFAIHHNKDDKAASQLIAEETRDEEENTIPESSEQTQNITPFETEEVKNTVTEENTLSDGINNSVEVTNTVEDTTEEAVREEDVLSTYYEYLSGSITYEDTILDESKTTFTIIDMNHDEIPELILDVGMDQFGMAVMQILYCYHNGSVVPIGTAGHGTFEIYSTGDCFSNSSLGMGISETNYYQIHDGELIQLGYYSSDVATGVDNPTFTYQLNNQEVDESEFNQFLTRHFSTDQPDFSSISGEYTLDKEGVEKAISDYKNREK